MIVWHERVFMDEKVRKNPMKYRRAVEKGKLKLSLYCVTFPSNPDNLLDIYHVNEFWFSHYRKQEITILGLAVSRKAAVDLVVQMVEEVYKATGDVDLRSYFCLNAKG